ncbi:methylmalonic aciduria and homocystinuria type D protein [Pantanalinema rosaneae CENA516]|uniref:methylmalonic aciduria and homocystinuria type D protein n=1 Tax=Pantanalinema rosaneae TaxID=1620701 RepID=UPI003D6EEDF0
MRVGSTLRSRRRFFLPGIGRSPQPSSMHCSTHVPSSYICTHTEDLLPSWKCPVASVLIVLQFSACDLRDHTAATEAEKQKLRQQFLAFGSTVVNRLRQFGYQTELFDPKTGLPTLSPPGTLHLDDVAVVRDCLGYPTQGQCGCSVILHPTWGAAVYPSVLLSSAPPELVRWVTEDMVARGG